MKDKKESAHRERMKKRKELLERIIGSEPATDIDGSYTGMSRDGSPPVQDADDL